MALRPSRSFWAMRQIPSVPGLTPMTIRTRSMTMIECGAAAAPLRRRRRLTNSVKVAIGADPSRSVTTVAPSSESMRWGRESEGSTSRLQPKVVGHAGLTTGQVPSPARLDMSSLEFQRKSLRSAPFTSSAAVGETSRVLGARATTFNRSTSTIRTVDRRISSQQRRWSRDSTDEGPLTKATFVESVDLKLDGPPLHGPSVGAGPARVDAECSMLVQRSTSLSTCLAASSTSSGTMVPGRFAGSLVRNRPNTGSSVSDSARSTAAATGTKLSAAG
jgi:hypothetical protein